LSYFVYLTIKAKPQSGQFYFTIFKYPLFYSKGYF